MQYSTRINKAEIFKIFLVCISSILLSVLISTAGETGEPGKSPPTEKNHPVSFSRNMDKKQMMLSYEGTDGVPTWDFQAGGDYVPHKISRLIHRYLRYFNCQGSQVKFNAFNIETENFDTSVNAVYDRYEEEVKIGISSDSLHRLLGPDVTMELLTNPSESSATVMFSIKI